MTATIADVPKRRTRPRVWICFDEQERLIPVVHFDVESAYAAMLTGWTCVPYAPFVARADAKGAG